MSEKNKQEKIQPSLEEQMSQLQDIVQKLEQPNTSIQDGIEYFGVGIKIAKDCLATLTEYKGQIVELKKECDNLIQTEFVL